MRHNFGVAEIAHVVILCVNEIGVPDACVTGPLVRAKGDKGRDTFTIPEGRKQQVVSTLGKNWPKDGLMSNHLLQPEAHCRCPLWVISGQFLMSAFL
jgi:hypothetical protein